MTTRTMTDDESGHAISSLQMCIWNGDLVHLRVPGCHSEVHAFC